MRQGSKKLLKLDSSTSRESSYLVLLEHHHYLPFVRDGKVIVPLNRSLMMGPGERKPMHLQIKSSNGQIRSVSDLTRQSLERF